VEGRRRSSARFLAVAVVGLVALAVALTMVANRGGRDELREVVLTPIPGSYSADLPRQLEDAAAVLRLRLAAIDKRTLVAIDRSTLVVTAPDAVVAQLEQLGSPGQLELRPVLSLETVDGCGDPPALNDPAAPVTLCSQDRRTRYELTTSRLNGTAVKSASAIGSGTIHVQLTTKGRQQFAALTRELSRKNVPQNQLAIVIDGVVLSAPEVRSTINGDTQITGEFTSEQAQALAATIRYGGLPVAFALSEG
jgi:preprotein translocase subunit SecD